MDYRPNVDAVLWFGNEILPQLKDVHFTIVGQQPHARLNALRELPNVTITGQVDSVLPYLQHTTVYVAPLRMGSGTRLKLLEAMACSCSIVTTQVGASGLSNTARSVMMIKDDAKSFAKAVNDLLNDETARHRYSRLACQTVADTYDWSVLIPRLLAVYSTIGVYDG
jgi:glycosyltransferase involved in cell wall biosynthesis